MNTAVLVTGDRYATESTWKRTIEMAFWHFRLGVVGGPERVVLIHGDQGGFDEKRGEIVGIDSIAGHLGDHKNRFNVVPMPYMGNLGTRGGPARNERMVAVLSALRDVGYGTLCLAFHDTIETSKGTKGCARLAFNAGHETHLIKSDGSRTRYLKSAAGIPEESR